MTKKDYNGWTNYETWAVKLWMDNEQGSSEYWNGAALEHLKHDRGTAAWSLESQLKEEHTEALPEVQGLAADLLNAAMSEVNWLEIAHSLLEDAKESLEA